MRKATLVSLTLVLATAAVGIARIQTPAAAAGVGTQASPASGLALDQIKMAPGFKIELFATGVTNAREMAIGSKGTVFVGSRNKPAGDTVYAVVDQNGDYKADQVIPIAKGLNEPSGVAFRDGTLYVGEIHRVVKFDNIESRLQSPGEPVVVTTHCRKTRITGRSSSPSDRTVCSTCLSAAHATSATRKRTIRATRRSFA